MKVLGQCAANKRRAYCRVYILSQPIFARTIFRHDYEDPCTAGIWWQYQFYFQPDFEWAGSELIGNDSSSAAAVIWTMSLFCVSLQHQQAFGILIRAFVNTTFFSTFSAQHRSIILAWKLCRDVSRTGLLQVDTFCNQEAEHFLSVYPGYVYIKHEVFALDIFQMRQRASQPLANFESLIVESSCSAS